MSKLRSLLGLGFSLALSAACNGGPAATSSTASLMTCYQGADSLGCVPALSWKDQSPVDVDGDGRAEVLFAQGGYEGMSLDLLELTPTGLQSTGASWTYGC